MHEEFSSGVIVYRGEGENMEFLFLTRKEGFLDFPKGHIEAGEDEVQSAVRETLEETGLEINPDTGFRYNQVYWYKRGTEKIKKSVVMFLGRVSDNAQVKTSFEHEGFRWMSFNEAMEQLSFKNQKEMLTTAMNYLIAHGQDR